MDALIGPSRHHIFVTNQLFGSESKTKDGKPYLIGPLRACALGPVVHMHARPI